MMKHIVNILQIVVIIGLVIALICKHQKKADKFYGICINADTGGTL